MRLREEASIDRALALEARLTPGEIRIETISALAQALGVDRPDLFRRINKTPY